MPAVIPELAAEYLCGVSFYIHVRIIIFVPNTFTENSEQEPRVYVCFRWGARANVRGLWCECV